MAKNDYNDYVDRIFDSAMLDDEEIAQSAIDQLMEETTFPFYMILAKDQDRVKNPRGGFRKYANRQQAIDVAKKYIRQGGTNGHETFLVIKAEVSAVVGHIPAEIPVVDVDEIRQKKLTQKDEE